MTGALRLFTRSKFIGSNDWTARALVLLAVILVFGCQSASRAQSPTGRSQTDAPPVLATLGVVQSWSHDLLSGIEQPGAPLSNVLAMDSPELTSDQENTLRRATMVVAYGGSHDRFLVDAYREMRPNGIVIKAREDAPAHFGWLDPVVAREDIRSLADQFSQVYVGDSERIEANRDRLIERIDEAERRVERLLAAYRNTEVLVENRNLRPMIDAWGLSVAAYYESTPGRTPDSEAIESWKERAESLDFPVVVATRQLGADALRNGDGGVPRITGIVVNGMRTGSLGNHYYAREMERNAMLFVAAVEPLRRTAAQREAEAETASAD